MKDWDDWQWQLNNRITTVEQLARHIDLTREERRGIEAASRRFTWAITPYYASLMDRTDRRCPIRMQAVPQEEEVHDDLGVPDPLEECKNSPVELIIRVYPDRLAFCVGNRCAVYCRHCLRKETVVGKQDADFSARKIDEGIKYIRDHSEIRDVLLTGGDPLLGTDEWLEAIIARLRAIPHVECIRIGSRTPCTLPQRITPQLCGMLENYHPIYLNIQFNHPREITPEAEAACGRLAAAGIPLGNQSVLLRGVNDSVEVMKRLCRELMRIRVRPYYIYQCQILSGTRHFRTPIECGIELVRNLQGFTSGLAVPKFIVDTPYGKIPVGPNYVIGREGDHVALRSWSGKIWHEPNPLPQEVSVAATCPQGAPAAEVCGLCDCCSVDG